MATLPVYNASVPYLALIPGAFYHGSMIRIKGTMNHGGDRFVINIQAGPAVSPSDDINLHLSVRPLEGAIVRNSLQSSNWQHEERYGGCPIYPGSPFEIIILAQSDSFKIAVNGTHFCQFNHRLALSTARFVYVTGEVAIQSMVQENDGTGGQPPAHVPAAPYHPPYPNPPYQPNPTYPAGIPGGIPVYPPHPPHFPPGPPHFGHGHQPGIAVPYPSHPGFAPSPYLKSENGYDHNQAAALSYDTDAATIKRQNRSKAMKYAAGAAGVAGGLGLGALAIASIMADGDDSDSD